VTTGDTRQAKLVSPIYVSEAAVFPKKRITLILGLLAGLFLGLLLIIVRKVWNNFRINQQ
jgi:uncharacterized protein involved in exopolysaccharide biosynthesis